jgi:hypothetical protein
MPRQPFGANRRMTEVLYPNQGFFHMNTAQFIGSIGVTLLLIAFTLQMLKIVDEDNPWYALTNIIGAALACISSIMINFLPFVILEGIWAIVGLIVLIRSFVRPGQRSR